MGEFPTGDGQAEVRVRVTDAVVVISNQVERLATRFCVGFALRNL